MKMMYGGAPVKGINIKKFDVSTDDATMIASDLHSGITAYARGQKITGTGRIFEFANYGTITTNTSCFIPTLINVVEVSGLDCSTKSLIDLLEIEDVDFTIEQTIAVAVIDNIEYPITVKIEGYILTFNCEKIVTLNYFLGKDRYV